MRKEEGLLIFLVLISLPSLFGIVRAGPVFSDPNNWNLIEINSSGWSDYQINIHALTKLSSIMENVNPGNSFFMWRTDRVDRYTDISFWKNGNNLSSCKSKDWARVNFYYGTKDELEFRFWVKGSGDDVRVWFKFPPQNYSPIVPPEQGVIATMPDLQSHVGNSSDLMGVTLFLGDGPYNGNLIINASNFTLKPSDKRNGEINGLENDKNTIKLNKVSHVKILKLNIKGNHCGINLEGSKNCVVEGNTIEACDGYGIYLGNSSSENSIFKNNLTSDGNSDDEPIVIYRSDNNNINCNNINSSCQSSHFYLKDSRRNNFTIHFSDDFYIDPFHYTLGQNSIFYNLSNGSSRIDGDPKKDNISIGDNWWRCCPSMHS
jgi:parallel beta-helix repeat protein